MTRRRYVRKADNSAWELRGKAPSVEQPPPPPPPPPSGLLQGVYRGTSGDGYDTWNAKVAPAGGVDKYEAWQGRQVEMTLTFIDEPSGDPNNRWSNFTYPPYVYQQLNTYGRSPCIGMGWFIASSKGNAQGNTTAALNLDGVRVGHDLAAAGAYVTRWQQSFDSMLANTPNGLPIYIRPCHEFNINQFAHRAQRGKEADFVAAWRLYVDTARARPGAGSRFKFMWNPVVTGKAEGNWNMYNQTYDVPDVDKCYPGDAWVDYIAFDTYDQGYQEYNPGDGGYYQPGFSVAQQRIRNWNFKVTGSFSPANIDTTKVSGINCLNGYRDYAKVGAVRNGVTAAVAKPLAGPEVGAWFGYYGGGDNPYYFNQLAAWVKNPANNVGMIAVWEDPYNGGQGVFDPDLGRGVPMPNSRAAFLANRPWGGS